MCVNSMNYFLFDFGEVEVLQELFLKKDECQYQWQVDYQCFGVDGVLLVVGFGVYGERDQFDGQYLFIGIVEYYQWLQVFVLVVGNVDGGEGQY